jgi:hypothetical protein
MPSAELPAIPTSHRTQTLALDRSALHLDILGKVESFYFITEPKLHSQSHH